MFGSRLNYDVDFFIDGAEISGVNSIDIGYQNAATATKPLGYHRGVVTVGGPTQQSLSVSRSLISKTPLEEASNGERLSGSLNYNGESYGFNNGYVTDYSVNCAVGAIPQTTYNIVVYDELRSGESASGTDKSILFIPSQGSISIACDNVSSNRVLGFDYSAQFPIKTYYTIGAESPTKVEYIAPSTYSATVQLDVDDALPESGYTFLTSGKNGRGGTGDASDVILTVNERGGTLLQSYSIPYPVLVSEQLNASADGSLRLTLNYIGHL